MKTYSEAVFWWGLPLENKNMDGKNDNIELSICDQKWNTTKPKVKIFIILSLDFKP